jgi:hypothetical protein
MTVPHRDVPHRDLPHHDAPQPHVTLDPSTLPPQQRKLHAALEDQLTSALRAAAERVAADYSGESVDELCARLAAEARRGLHPDVAAGWRPDPGELRRVAQAIIRDEQRF